MKTSSLPSLSWLQSFYAKAQVTSATPPDEVQAKARQLNVPDPDLAARVAKFLPPQPSTGTSFSEADVSDAFSKLVATDSKSTHWRDIIRGAEQPMAEFFMSLDAQVPSLEATKMGLMPNQMETRDELAALWRSAG